jgi:carboxypeptidase C (cathepsin A)
MRPWATMVMAMMWLTLLATALLAQGETLGASGKKEEPPPEDKQSVTNHTVMIGGREVPYRATTGTMVLKDEEGKAKASLFFVAYTKQDVPDSATRPILFSFNGGPGSSSVWLHLGLLGPRRVVMGDPPDVPAPPGQLVDNVYSLLDVTDLVFIDPVTTGFSRPAPGQDANQFHSVQGDIESVGEFVRLYTTRNARWSSPKFLAGESYGTTRAAGLAAHLQSQLGMFLNGVILISSVLNFETLSDDRGNDLPFALFLPTFTATAWYHKRLAPELQGDLAKTLAEVQQFAQGDYTLALMKGDALEPAARSEIARRLARYTGLGAEFIERANLRVSMDRFTKELLRADRRTVGRLDSRYLGIDYDSAGENFEADASYAAIQGPYTAALNQYVRSELKFESDLPYEILTGRVQPWNFGAANRYLDVADRLRSAMIENRNLRVFVACGYYDLATPYFAAHYTFQHLGLDPTLTPHITMGHYPAGHMMYIHEPSLKQLRADLVAFIQTALGR